MQSLSLSFFIFLSSLLLSRFQQAGNIIAPVAGQAVQGIVAIPGTSQVQDFQSAEVAFAYQGDPTETWFLIAQSDAPVLADTLAIWDTTTITDAVYNLRLRIFLTDGSMMDTIVTDVRVRNYTPIETDGDSLAILPTPGLLPLSPTAFLPEPTPLPPNPAAVTPEGIYRAMLSGGLIVVFLFALLGILTRLRRR